MISSGPPWPRSRMKGSLETFQCPLANTIASFRNRMPLSHNEAMPESPRPRRAAADFEKEGFE
ncbi:hypothetical protein A3A67_03130 [Candidatus Peribacteria bacterium RIFCSPLOWO2_01_FULL_51_18]|nr:MAG: hypothetical protein A3C52_05135 [Candidatus Peribacteria bacterium RIFCSPHIGHO2_02_FULL_51_15]OGJ66037.1 MAG: hypothetical protein A3A67_03130 [Candidatus Peribacteria bacterium RIFCSPLOWO2_01_FULL_51_18]OGJ69229.1 MAG: hypothetical protein A3J34_00325 [Candidatus Peribacteria bacterium RIFCSPLOWO2_02_FULL_51_10]